MAVGAGGGDGLGLGDELGLGEGDGLGLGDGKGLGVGDGVGPGDSDGSGVGALLTSIDRLAVPVLPAASVAIAVIVCAPFVTVVVSNGSVHVVVPLASCGEAPSIRIETFCTDLLSDAVPATVTVPLASAAGDGVEIATVGGDVSHCWCLLQPPFPPPPPGLFPPAANAPVDDSAPTISPINASSARTRLVGPDDDERTNGVCAPPQSARACDRFVHSRSRPSVEIS